MAVVIAKRKYLPFVTFQLIVSHYRLRIEYTDDVVLHSQQARFGAKVAIHVKRYCAEVLCERQENPVECTSPPHDFLLRITDGR
ncbi:hypothetical protein D3C76_1349140 [compost metagenome]